MSAKSYDLIVIGSGPAGEKGGAAAAYFGKKVAIIERDANLGGAAANTGTLPSKTLRETALMLSGARARGFGVDFSLKGKTSIRDFMYKERRVTATERTRVASNIRRHNMDVYQGCAKFVDPHTVEIRRADGSTERIQGAVFLIATGSSPFRPDMFFATNDPRIRDSDTILNLKEMPKSMIVIGGGVIGSEYACTFAAQGVEVSLIDSRDILLPFLDREISLSLMDRMRKLGINLLSEVRVDACMPEAEAVTLTLSNGTSVSAECVLVAAGRNSNTQELDLPAAGVTPGKRGLIEVDKTYRTSVPHIYAAGDVIGFPALASTSMEQARSAVANAFDLSYKVNLAPILPYGIYTIPEVSMAGETEDSLQAKNVDYVIGKALYGQNPRGEIIGDMDGFLKLLFNRADLKLLGVHVIGESASEVVHIGLLGLMTNATADLFVQTCFNYPTLGDLYKYASYDAMGRKQRGER